MSQLQLAADHLGTNSVTRHVCLMFPLTELAIGTKSMLAANELL
jgi:hypothetical protein